MAKSSFGAYFKSIEEGQGDAGQAYVTLPTGIHQLVREDARRYRRSGRGGAGATIRLRAPMRNDSL